MARLHWTYMYETKTADELNENCKFTLCQQVALIEQQKYSLSLFAAVNKAALGL